MVRKSKSGAEPDFFAEAAEIGKLGAGKCTHFLGDVGDDLGEKGADEGFALGGELHDDEAAIGRIAFAADIAGFLQVIHHQSEIASALEELLGQFALAERADVVECLQHAELGNGQAIRQNVMHTDRDRLSRALKLDKCVERIDLFDCAPMSCSHRLLI